VWPERVPLGRQRPRALYCRHVVERAVVTRLRGGVNLHGDVLDAGCGSGGLHAPPGRPRSRSGPDDRDRPRPRPDRRRRLGVALVDALPGADATELPYDDASFDVVAQFTALCNLLDARLRVRAGRELARVVRPRERCCGST
jgi:SAM-dependent methyltransferase